MAYADRIANTDAANEHSLASSATALFRLVHHWWRAWRAERALSSCSDAMLKDIGLSRGEIGDAVRTGRPRIRRGRR